MKDITVIGAGTMGNGIAHVFAQNGFEVYLVDTSAVALERALTTISANLDRQIKKGILTEPDKKQTLSAIRTTTDLEKGVSTAEMVVEAVTEKEELKLDIFKRISNAAPENAILASNTSSISITRIAAATNRPDKVIGMHFMNPVPVMKLVEVVNGYATSEETTSFVLDLVEKLGKIPGVANDYPGFVANRILMPMINEAISALFEGVAGVESIDTIMKSGMAHPMGPLRLADFIGLDVCLSILNVLHHGFGNPGYAPCPLLVNMVAAGKLGVKSGEGFYKYTAGSKIAEVSNRFK